MNIFSRKTRHESVSVDDYNALLDAFEENKSRLACYESFVEDAPVAFFVKDSEAKFQVVNKAYRSLFGINREDIINKSLCDVEYFSEDDRKNYHNSDIECIQKLDCMHYEVEYKLQNGTHPVLLWSRGFEVKGSEKRGLVGIIVEIGLQKNLERNLEKTVAQLKKSQEEVDNYAERMQLLLDNMPLSAQIWTTDFRILETSLEMARIFGFDNKEDYIENIDKLNPEYQPDGQKSFDKGQKIIAETMEKGHAKTQWTHISLSGEEIPFDVTLISSFLQGQPVILAFMKDLREHLETMKRLREADDYTRLMLDSNPFGALIWDQHFNLVHCNKALAQTFGLKEAQEFIDNFASLVPEYQPDGELSYDKIQQELIKTFTTGSTECFWMGKSIHGEELPTKITGVRTKYRGEYMAAIYVQDLTAEEINKKKTLLAEQRIQGILNGVPLGINLLDADFQMMDCNNVAAGLLRCNSKEEYFAAFENQFPEKQPDGSLTKLLLEKHIAIAAREGKSQFEIVVIDTCKQPVPMGMTLVSAHLENEEVFIAYSHDLRESKRLLQEVEQARDAAEKSAQVKSDFLANMSHEIRTPMNGILGLLHILSDTELNEQQQDFLKKALFSTNELLRIINDILDFSKIEAGKLKMECVPFTLQSVCTEVVNLLGHIARQKGLDFSVEQGKHSELAIIGDPLRLKQVLINLLGNAIKFTSKGSVSLIIDNIKMLDQKLHCKFTVKDTGIGLSKEQIKTLFSAFSQADTSVTRKYGGTGLGLVIAKSFVELMQGCIFVDSKVGEGSNFTFTATFPLASENQLVREDLTEIAYNTSAHAGGHLLLVEDNQINQLIAEELLKKDNYTLDIANNGQEALTMLTQKKYDAVLMDIQMPIMDGLTATKLIRKQKEFDTLPIIAMSAHAMTGDKEKSIAHGMNDHITKPIIPEILYSTLDYWIHQK